MYMVYTRTPKTQYGKYARLVGCIVHKKKFQKWTYDFMYA